MLRCEYAEIICCCRVSLIKQEVAVFRFDKISRGTMEKFAASVTMMMSLNKNCSLGTGKKHTLHVNITIVNTVMPFVIFTCPTG